MDVVIHEFPVHYQLSDVSLHCLLTEGYLQRVEH